MFLIQWEGVAGDLPMHHHRAAIEDAAPSFREAIESIRAMNERYPRRKDPGGRLPARPADVRRKLDDLMRRLVSAFR